MLEQTKVEQEKKLAQMRTELAKIGGQTLSGVLESDELEEKVQNVCKL